MDKKSYSLALSQGIFYLIMGVWPVVDIDSFMAVTGGKTDLWLVKTVGLLILCTGFALTFAYIKKDLSKSLGLVALLNAFFLGIIDVYYSLNGTISKVYLADAVVEIFIFSAWSYLLFRQRKISHSPLGERSSLKTAVNWH